MAIGMIQEGIANNVISKLTGLSIEEIEILRHQSIKKKQCLMYTASF